MHQFCGALIEHVMKTVIYEERITSLTDKEHKLYLNHKTTTFAKPILKTLITTNIIKIEIFFIV